MGNLEYTASNLYDGGWRAEDGDAIRREYDFTPEEVGEICRLLTEYERKEAD